MQKLPALIVLLGLSLSACTAAQRYDLGQGFRRDQCTQNITAERLRCLEQADKSYKDYKDGR